MNYKLKVPFSYVDESLNLSYYNTGILISDAVCDFLDENKIDNSIFSKTHSALWVVLKNKINIYNIAKYKDDLDINVEFLDIKKLCITIGVVVKKDDVLYADAYVCLAAINSTNHNIIDISMLNLFDIKKESINLYSRFKNNMDGFLIQKEVKPLKRDIDFSRHVNNLVYIRWLIDILNEQNIYEFKSIEIHYLKEIKFEDKVSIYFKKEESSVYFIIYTKEINAKGLILV